MRSKHDHDAGLRVSGRSFSSPHPGCVSFDDDEMEVCVQISPGGFFRFSQSILADGKQFPFCLQGYYNYRHLLLSHTKEKIYIGIPGQYHRRDKYLADMFEFGRFKEYIIADPA